MCLAMHARSVIGREPGATILTRTKERLLLVFRVVFLFLSHLLVASLTHFAELFNRVDQTDDKHGENENRGEEQKVWAHLRCPIKAHNLK